MPPKASAATKGKDIRTFFASGSAATQKNVQLPAQRKTASEVIEISEDESPSGKAQPKKPTSSPKTKIIESDDEEVMKVDSSHRLHGVKKKRKSQVIISDVSSGEVSEDEKPKKKHKTEGESRSKPAPAAKANQAIPSPNVAHTSKPNFVAARAAKLAGPSNPGGKDIPDGDEFALEGLTLVFTGELSSFSREEAHDITKRFGGRVTLQPSSKTSFVVVGEGAGPSKLRALEKHGIQQLDEDGWLKLIATRKGPTGKDSQKLHAKRAKEEREIRERAKEMEDEERRAKGKAQSAAMDVHSQLWTTKYAPTSLKDICGNKASVEKLKTWLDDWQKNYNSSFKKPGKSATGNFRAVLITGPPGIGKTTSAHLCAQAAGYTPIELNASDTRSKKLIENGMNVDNKTIDGWIGGGQATNSLGVPITDKTCLIMDEVDGMSAGDRGGVGALNALIKTSKVPIICIANDRNAQKLKPLTYTCFSMNFQRPQPSQVRSRIMSIAYREKMKIPPNVVDQLIAGAQSDIRLVLNMLSAWRLAHEDNASMDYDEGKRIVKANEKTVSVLSPFEVTSRVLGPYMFSHTNRETLGDKMEYYFMDHSFVPLFIQENYLKPEPAKCKNLSGPEKELKLLEVMDMAATSLSDGDLVDALIHGPDQQWSLMPLHAICSTIRPASFMFGSGMNQFGSSFGGSSNALSFPQWLGQNSRQSKLMRALGDVQVRMRLKASGDKNEVRQTYLPTLHRKLVAPLASSTGTDAIPSVIETMDEYYLSKDDWDTIVELGVDANNQDAVLKGIPSAVKSGLTRRYNATEHPIAYHKATELGGRPAKKLAAGPAPDVEDAIEVDEEPEPDSSDEGTKKNDVLSDKLVKASKKAAALKGRKSRQRQ